MKIKSRKTTTFRLEADVAEGLETISAISGTSRNNLVNEALRVFIGVRAESLSRDVEAVLERLNTYRKSDPELAKSFQAFADAEAALEKDPLEGEVIDEATGSVEERVVGILDN